MEAKGTPTGLLRRPALALTAAVCSFRTAKALRTNPGSRHAIQTFRWPNSVKFDWHSQQLMDLGLMEPGQWF